MPRDPSAEVSFGIQDGEARPQYASRNIKRPRQREREHTHNTDAESDAFERGAAEEEEDVEDGFERRDVVGGGGRARGEETSLRNMAGWNVLIVLVHAYFMRTVARWRRVSLFNYHAGLLDGRDDPEKSPNCL
ncbi:hypothetical protein GWI33_007293 [Rhynchophorus ferrugineus]|uniref:Uncharacterized protein n=1 Tax=Rhynchophorus ferrugineus TaxID=354439 RepID=A0A834IDT4_RHYFE|nr:hypothetical protein GWI33_007293 [Rhynchophorus ferrugineus]